MWCKDGKKKNPCYNTELGHVLSLVLIYWIFLFFFVSLLMFFPLYLILPYLYYLYLYLYLIFYGGAIRLAASILGSEGHRAEVPK